MKKLFATTAIVIAATTGGLLSGQSVADAAPKTVCVSKGYWIDGEGVTHYRIECRTWL